MSRDDLSHLFPTADDATLHEASIAPIEQRGVLVDGEMRDWTGPVKNVFSPVMVRGRDGGLTQIRVGSYPSGDASAAITALDAAVAAYDSGRGAWPSMRVSERILAMQRFLAEMCARRAEVTRLIMWEIGKTLSDSEKEFDRTVDYVRQTIGALRNLDNANSRFEIVDGVIGLIRRTPIGVVLCMGPYNYPLNETFATLIPALIMGNCVVFTPPRHGVLLFEPLLELFRTTFPPGVLNFAYGDGAEIVPKLLETGKINVLTLIGSSRVADHLKKLHPRTNRLRAILGLDAKNAAIIMPDADIALAAKECLLGALSFNGQRCTALKMLLVHRDVADPFISALLAELTQLKIGMPWGPEVTLTPLPNIEKVSQMNALLDDAVTRGARILNPGGGLSVGTLFYPAVVYPVGPSMRLFREEQFGPIIPVLDFDDVDLALDYVATSEHGQQVSLFARDPDVIGRMSDALVNQVCRVNLNCQCQRGPDVFPFTGRKDAAEGTLSVTDALRSFSIRSMVAAKYTSPSREILNTVIEGRHSNFIHTDFIL
ncbi:NADP-dependent glyceraldehyde-3-phosphate dehydrogenase [Bradyrhizobium sp. SBR1B]|uniref:NADP-dependent glyceraldehyde-3-phosphate dehydrogenase n=1 Tax=Bradyrhizobium sp. SBR1B TaxID=2663836 RepID=UPI0017A45464|nr:NADP-dependent glyceraldehyde-3-phosphate dehydrogenase [Bradyrhizobium sp. SBR1B]MBB4383220.1 acyl-CoA reductase-like NAD-dependent aldehyde dehydrogenase [Bradyrhizobium sp. SBR1B]